MWVGCRAQLHPTHAQAADPRASRKGVRRVTTHQTDQRPNESDAGFGVIEIVVSMFLLSLLAVAFLPLLIESMTVTVRNSTIATASQLVSQQLDEVRIIASNCADVSAFDDVAITATTDARGTVFQPHREVAACPAAYPGVVQVRAWVTESGDPKALAEAVTLVYVESATP